MSITTFDLIMPLWQFVIIAIITIGVPAIWALIIFNREVPDDYPLGPYDNVKSPLSPEDWQKMLRAYMHHVEAEAGNTFLISGSREQKFIRDLTDKQYYALKGIIKRGY